MRTNCIPWPTSSWPRQWSWPWPMTSARWNRVPWRNGPRSTNNKKELYITHKQTRINKTVLKMKPKNKKAKIIEMKLTFLPLSMTSINTQKQRDIRHPSISLNLNHDYHIHTIYVRLYLYTHMGMYVYMY